MSDKEKRCDEGKLFWRHSFFVDVENLDSIIDADYASMDDEFKTNLANKVERCNPSAVERLCKLLGIIPMELTDAELSECILTLMLDEDTKREVVSECENLLYQEA
jgi:hypothetical protein